MSYRTKGPTALLWGWMVVVSLGVALPSAVRGEEADKVDTPPTHTVSRESLRIDVVLEGVFEAEAMTEVLVDPDGWTEFRVKEAVAHGAVVRRGETLVRFDTERIDDAIVDLEAQLERSRLDLEQRELDVRISEQSLPLELSASERLAKEAEQNFDRFRNVVRPLREKQLGFTVRSRQDYLDYQKEELRQLEKMYKDDDLTEDTEEIILRRQRDAVDRAIFALEQAKEDKNSVITIELPRRETSLKAAASRQSLAWTRQKTTLPMNLTKQKLEIERTKKEYEKSEERLGELRADRRLMTVTSEADGTVYYGQCTRGRWSRGKEMSQKLRDGGKVHARDVFMTIVTTRPMFVRATVPEKELGQLRTGLSGRATPTSHPKTKLLARVDEVAKIPLSPGTFEVRVSVEEEAGDAIVPGMSCSVKVTVYEREDALTIPTSAVHTDPPNDNEYVFLWREEGSHEKRIVKTGRVDDKRVEILDGLAENDQVLLEKPKD